MRTQSEISALLAHPGVIAVVRTQQPEQVLPLCAALDAGAVACVGDDVRSLTCSAGKSETPHVVSCEDSLPSRHRPVA